MLYALLVLPIAFTIVFRYIPMTYIVIAFKKYNITKSVWQMEWADNHGFQYFIQAFNDKSFLNALRNTIVLNLLDLIFGFPAPILVALLLNEVRFPKLKKVTQTIIYMPHFLSWVIISSLALQLFAPTTGLINLWITSLGGEAIPFLNDPGHWVATYVLLGIWQSTGWNTIIYLAAITGINPELYEAAAVDGAGRFQRMWHITLPGIRSTIVVLLILNLGHILDSSFERPYALSNSLVKDVSDVLATYIYSHGVRGLQFSLTTAVGLFQSVVGVIFLLISNTIARRLDERGVW